MDVKKKVAKTSKTKQVVDWLAQQMETNSDGDDDYISTDNNNKRKGNNSNSFFNSTGFKKKMKQPTIDCSLDKCSPERVKMITRFLTKFIVSNAIPFTIAQSESFIEMIGASNKAYLPYLPKVDKFRTTCLEELFQDTKKKINAMWNDKGNPYRTMGYDGHTGEINNHVVIVTETVEDQTAFVTCLDAKEQKENQEWIAKNIMDKLEKKTTASLGVEQVFPGIVNDNVRVNKSAAKIIRQKYPKLFTPGCCTHIFDLLIEDVAKLPEINEIIKGCTAIAVFVKGHTRVKAAYQCIISGSNGGTMLKTFPDTRFSYADLMLQVVNNRKNLSNLMDEEQYASNTVADINVKKREEFEGYVGNFSFMEKVETLRGISGPLRKAIHHLESAKCRASWVYPMFIAVLKDYDVWKQKYATKRCFGEETIKKVYQVIMGRWLGVSEAGSTIVLIKDNTWLMGYLMDPY